MLYLTYKPTKKRKKGKSFLSQVIRSGSNQLKRWKYKSKKRDNFTCQNCNGKEDLEVHHIKPFAQIFKEFLEKNKQFSLKKNVVVLRSLAKKYTF